MALGTTNINLPEIPVGYEQLVNYAMLYDAGDECKGVTGGINFVESGGGSYAKNADHIYMSQTMSSKSTYYASVNTIDVTDCSSFFAVMTYKRNTTSTSGNSVGSFLYPSKTNPNSFESGVSAAYARIGNGYSSAQDVKIFNNVNIVKEGKFYLILGNYGSISKHYHVGITKADDFRTLCEKAGISAPTDLATLIADISKLTTIFASKDAVKWMVARCTGDFMASVVANSTALNLLKTSPHYTMVQANEHWAKFLAMVA